MLIRLAPLCLAAILALPLAVPALAQSEADIHASIETLHGDADGFFALFTHLQDAIADDDLATVSEYGLYPLAVNDSDGNYEVIDAEDFLDNVDIVFSVETRQALLDQDVADLIVTSEGVGVGNGALWITNVCLDESCAETRWGILSINN